MKYPENEVLVSLRTQNQNGKVFPVHCSIPEYFLCGPYLFDK